jgi:hypothetical protein
MSTPSEETPQADNASLQEQGSPPGSLSFGLPFMFGLTTYVAVIATLLVYAPALGGVLCFLALPTTVRTMVIDSALREQRDEWTPVKRMLNPVVSLVVVALIMVAFAATFFCTYWGIDWLANRGILPGGARTIGFLLGLFWAVTNAMLLGYALRDVGK